MNRFQPLVTLDHAVLLPKIYFNNLVCSRTAEGIVIMPFFRSGSQKPFPA
jgi:hypothetical protein